MDNLGILVQAILSLKDTKASKDQIASELPKLESQLQSDKNTRVKIVAGLDIAKSKNLIQTQLNTLTNQAKAPTIKIGVDTSGLQNAQKPINDVLNVQRNLKTQSNDVTNQVIANERKKQEAYKATAESVVYHAGVISKYNKAETNGRFYGSSRGTGYFGTGHYFVDSAHKSEIMSEPFVSKPFTSVDISKYDNLFKANTNEIADALHSFLQRLTQYTQGLNSVDVPSLFEEFKKVFTSATMNIQEFDKKVSQLKAYMSSSSLNDRNDSVSTQFMKSLGYGGVDTRGTKYADTRYGTVIYDLKEESVLQANITNELQKQGQMLEQISYKTGEVFDKETDRLLQSKVQQSKLNSEIQAEYQKSFDNTNLKNAEAEYKNAEQSLTKINELIGYYENNIRNTTTEVQKLAQEMKSLGLEMTPDEIKDEENRLLAESKQNLEEKIKEKQTIEQTIPVLKDKYEQELALSQQAYEKAKQVVEERHKETTAIEQQAQATERLKATQAQAQQTSNVVTNASANIGNFARTISTQYRTEFGVVTDVIKQAETEFARFGEVSAVSNKSVKAFEGVPEHFKDFTIQVKSATGTVQKFFYTFENVGDKDNPVFKYMLQNINEADAGVKRLADDIEKAKAQYTSKLAGFESTNSQIKTGLSAEIAKVNDEINKLGTNNGSIQNLKVAFDNLTASANKIKENLKATGASLNPIDNAINKYKNMDNVLKEITTSFNNLAIKPTGLGDSLNSVKSQLIELQNLEKSEGGYTEAWAKKYRDVSLAVAEVKTNIELALKAEKSDKGSSYQTQLKYLNKIKEETNTIISLKRKMVNAGDEEKALYQHEITNAQKRIQYDVQQLDKKKLLTDEAKRLVNTYKEQIALQDKINSAKTSDKNVQAQSEQLKNYVTQVSKAITQLNSLQNSPTFTKNASNPQVTQTKQDINSLITAYQNLMTKLQGNITPAGLETVRTELTQLNASFNDTTATAQRFEQSLKDDNGAEKLAQKVAVLTSRIEAYRKANSKSESKFGSRYDALLTELANPNIDENAYNRIAKQFQVIRQEVNAANVAGKNFLQTFKEKLGKFTGWMSMTYAVSMFTRSVRQAITELKEVDTLLTEISKANDKLTNSQLAQMGSNSFGIASKYGKQATDYLKGVQEMSRAGYANAEAMGELSTAAQGAGDMTADVANQFIIATDKAYKMNGSVEQLTKTLDGINYITNNNAVNMSELSEGFSIVSSTAASFGVRADELSAALGTMAATTQQSGSEVARAFRAILLNIRQVSDKWLLSSNQFAPYVQKCA